MFTARVELEPVVAWIDEDAEPWQYADRDPATGEDWPDDATALSWAQDQADTYNTSAADATVVAAAYAVQASFAAFDADPATDTQTTVVYEVTRITGAWGPSIEAEVLEGYSVVGQLALRVFDPWDGSIPFAEVDGRLIATVVGVVQTDPLYPWEYGIWVEGIALDHQILTGPGPDAWLATRLIVDGAPVGGGSVPA